MAGIPFSFECNRQNGFIMDPNAHSSIGYVTSFDGLGLAVAARSDLTVSIPFSQSKPPLCSGLQIVPSMVRTSSGGSVSLPTSQATVVGVIEKFSWNGGAGDPIHLDFWVSQANATQFKVLQQQFMKTGAIKAFGWWIAGYDQDTKQWFEQAYPRNASVSGLLAKQSNPALDVDLNGVQAKDGLDVLVYKVSIAVAPAANAATMLHFANSSRTSVLKSWGLVVGTLTGHVGA